jgi:ABC-2 type transport system ATP-binding protein
MIEINKLQKIIDQRLALQIEAMQVQGGEIAAVVGHADSGVDTLLEILAGRSTPSAGTVRLAGADPADRAALSRQAGFLFAQDGLYKRQTARDNLALYCRLYGLPSSRADEALALVGMADQASVPAERLPSGLQRRLAVARAILHRPGALVLVEPFARCDEASIGLLRDLMRQLAADGAAALILAHDEAGLATLCDTIYTLEDGRVVKSYRPQEEARAALPFKIPVRLEDKVALVNPGDILYVEARGDRACLHLASGELPTQFTLTELEERLKRSGFFRAHRSYLVNLQHVCEVVPYTRNSFSLTLDDDNATEIPLSKSAAADLRQLLQF